jgi:hypothetical protein
MIGPPFCHNASGATFSEVMVAIVLTSIGIMTVMAAFEAADRRLGRDTLAARALAAAESRLEAKRAAPWKQLLSDDFNHDGVPDLTMHDDGSEGDRIAGDGIYSAMLEGQGVTVIWTVAFAHSQSLSNSGMVVIEARGVYRAGGEEREVRLATLRANPAFAGNH